MTHYERIYELLKSKLNDGSENIIFIPGNVPSKKNSKEIVQIYTGLSSCCQAKYIKTKTGFICTKCNSITRPGKRPIITDSKTTKEYREKNAKYFLNEKVFNAFQNKKYPLALGFFFIRDTLRLYDFNNVTQIICDMLVDSNIIPDDNTTIIIPLFLGELKDPKNPGVILTIMENYPSWLYEKVSQKGV